MSGLRDLFTKSWSGSKPFFDIRTPLTGCGFTLAFGWLWFPVLRDVLLRGLFTGQQPFHPLAFILGLGAGCFLYGFLYRRLKNGAMGQKFPNAALAHGIPPLLFGLLLLTWGMGLTFTILDEALLGLAGALPGVWWTTRLLASGPRKAIASLAWAAFTALVLSLPLSWAQPHNIVTICILVASIALAYLTALFLGRRKREYGGEGDTRPDTVALSQAPPPGGPSRWIYVLLLFGVGPIFFSVGSLSVLVHGTEGTLQALAQLCALTAAVFILDGSLELMLAISACVLTVLAFCLSLSPVLAPMLYPVGAGLLEATGVALCACALRREVFGQGATAVVAGLFLTVTLAAVNGGYLTGLKLISFAGKIWPLLPGLATALLLAAAAYQGRKYVTGTNPAQDRTEQESPLLSADSGRAPPSATTVSPPFAGQLTEREQSLAFLLINGYNNKAAAECLGLTDNTLRWHIKNLNKKTGATEREELIMALKRISIVQE